MLTFVTQGLVRLAKSLMPEASKALVVYSNEPGSEAVGEKMLNEARKAGICITAVLKADFLSDNDSDVVDRVLEQAEKGL